MLGGICSIQLNKFLSRVIYHKTILVTMYCCYSCMRAWMSSAKMCTRAYVQGKGTDDTLRLYLHVYSRMCHRVHRTAD